MDRRGSTRSLGSRSHISIRLDLVALREAAVLACLAKLHVIAGEHEHTIIGYSLVKGIGDGEPIASERFTVGGHEWVLLFYPDGKRSSSSEAGLGGGVGAVIGPPPGAGNGFEGNSCLMLGRSWMESPKVGPEAQYCLVIGPKLYEGLLAAPFPLGRFKACTS